MKNLFNLSLIAQLTTIVLFAIHILGSGLGSNFMFAVLIFALLNGAYLLWRSFRNKDVTKTQRVLGFILGFAGVAWLLAFGFGLAFGSIV